jgi:cysteine synthase
METTISEQYSYQYQLTPPLLELPQDRLAQYERISATIGNTPLRVVSEVGNGRFVSKEEWRNPSGCHYDRAYLPTLAVLEGDGLIRPGDELRDITSGSAGSSLAMLAAELGYPVRITVPDELPANRLQSMRQYGAEIINAGLGYIHKASDFQRAEMVEFAKEPAWKRILYSDKDLSAKVFEHRLDGRRICYINHSENLLTPKAFASIGHELVSQVAEPPAAVALAMGNWTTIAGISPVLRAAWPDTLLIGYEGEKSEEFTNYGTTNHDAVGTNVPVRFRDETLLDGIRIVSNSDRDAMHELVNTNKPLTEQVGRSSLMGLVIARAVAEEQQTDRQIVTIAYDTMNRY